MKVFVITPTYNEKENIGNLVNKVLALPVGAEVVVVDDNSPDGTGRLLDALAAGEPRLHVIHRPGKLGLGTAHIAGLRYALAGGADFAVTMDADLSHDPAYIPAMLEAARSFDLVIGSRYADGGAAVNSPAHRRALSRGANLFARLVLGLRAGDCTAGFRCYGAAVLKALDLDAIFSDGYSFLIEVLAEIQARGFSIGEVPIKFIDREMGASKISRSEIRKAVYTVLRLGLRRALPAGLSRNTGTEK